VQYFEEPKAENVGVHHKHAHTKNSHITHTCWSAFMVRGKMRCLHMWWGACNVMYVFVCVYVCLCVFVCVYSTRYQSDSFSLITVASGFNCLCGFPYFLNYQQGPTAPTNIPVAVNMMAVVFSSAHSLLWWGSSNRQRSLYFLRKLVLTVIRGRRHWRVSDITGRGRRCCSLKMRDKLIIISGQLVVLHVRVQRFSVSPNVSKPCFNLQ